MNKFTLGFVCGVTVTTWAAFIFLKPNIYPTSQAYAEKACIVNGGVEYFEEGYTRFAKVRCKNGASFEFNPYKPGEQ